MNDYMINFSFRNKYFHLENDLSGLFFGSHRLLIRCSLWVSLLSHNIPRWLGWSLRSFGALTCLYVQFDFGYCYVVLLCHRLRFEQAVFLLVFKFYFVCGSVSSQLWLVKVIVNVLLPLWLASVSAIDTCSVGTLSGIWVVSQKSNFVIKLWFEGAALYFSNLILLSLFAHFF